MTAAARVRDAIFVTGATGYIGSHVLASVERPERTLICLTRSPRPPVFGVEWVHGAVEDPQPWSGRLRDCSAVLHLATMPLSACENDPALGERTIVTGFRNLFEAAIDAGIARFTIASTTEVYGSDPPLPITRATPLDPASWYGYCKASVDLYALFRGIRSGLDVTIVRLSNVYGHDAGLASPETVLVTFAQRIAAGEPVVLHGPPENSRDFVHVRDAARAIWSGLETDSGTTIVNVGTGVETTLRSAAERIAEFTGATLQLDLRPDDGRRRRARVDEREAAAALDFVAATAFDDGLREVVADAAGER